MGLETGDTIADLNPNWPLGTDPKSQGDDHLRLIKEVMQSDALSLDAGGDVIGPMSFEGFATFLDGMSVAKASSFAQRTTMAGIDSSSSIVATGASGAANLLTNGYASISTANGTISIGDNAVTAFIDATTGHPIEMRISGAPYLLVSDAGLTATIGGAQLVLQRVSGGEKGGFGVATNGNVQVFPKDGQVLTYGNAAPDTAPSASAILSRIMGDNRYTQTAAFRAGSLRTLGAMVMLMEALGVDAATRDAIRDILDSDD